MELQIQKRMEKETRETVNNLIRNDILDTFFEESIVLVGDIMKRDVVTLDHTKTVYDAALLMIEKNVGCIIVTAFGKPFGIVTERDIVRTMTVLNLSIKNLLLSVLASRPIIYTSSDQTIEEAIEIMKQHHIRRLPVFDKETLVGLVTLRDLTYRLSLSEKSILKIVIDDIE